MKIDSGWGEVKKKKRQKQKNKKVKVIIKEMKK